ncbi:enoyl-CoA hydratase-related protein, partial [Rhodospirillaceae bacterium]|nr:enoyl-CoA hydratase-related protein [Rhodospirillaceae bacterium]
MNVQLDSRATGSGKIATIVYDRQSKLNSLNGAGIKELKAAFQNVAKDTELRGLIFTGAGPKSFIGGADINELNELNEKTSREFITSLHELFILIRNMEVPTIARVNGYSLGAGMELAAACDIRIASSTAIFGMPEVKVGVPSVIEAALLPRLVGWGRANYLVLTGENIDANTAYDWGFVEKVVEGKDLDGEIQQLTDIIANCGPLAT